MSDSTSTEDFVEAEVERTIAPLRSQGYSPALLEEMANLLRMALTTHPTGRYLMSRARPRTAEGSGTQAVGQGDGASRAGGSR